MRGLASWGLVGNSLWAMGWTRKDGLRSYFLQCCTPCGVMGHDILVVSELASYCPAARDSSGRLSLLPAQLKCGTASSHHGSSCYDGCMTVDVGDIDVQHACGVSP